MQFRIAGTQYRQFDGRCTQNTPVACIMNNTVFPQAQITYALVAQELKGPGLQRHHWAHENSSVIWSAMSSLCWSLPHLLTSSLPQHEAQPGQHQNLVSRKAALTNRSRTSITRVAETRAKLLPQVMSPKSLRQAKVLGIWSCSLFEAS